MTRILAFYLPQFHPIPENDAWWGKGFTEWTNVRKAKPLYANHEQPRVPLNENYYRLDDVATLRWQADLMSRYGVDGACFYHYWFNGKLLLQTPMELLLRNPGVEMPFCVSWANEPWTRTWSGKHRDVIMPQEYGSEADWERHFAYLLPFFRDRRYIRHDGQPLLLIYRAASIPDFDSMIGLWRRKARESGLPGLHVVVTNTGYVDDRTYREHDAAVDFEPHSSLLLDRSFLKRVRRRAGTTLRQAWTGAKSGFRQPQLLHLVDYDEIWAEILRRPIRDGVYPGTFVDWDNSPRRGANGALIFKGFSVEKFAAYFRHKYLQAAHAKAPFVFVNAWNEWAEGTYLEPDMRRGVGALEAILAAKGAASAPT
jgi:lipopolysaccharide biosynthesis protein